MCKQPKQVGDLVFIYLPNELLILEKMEYILGLERGKELSKRRS